MGLLGLILGPLGTAWAFPAPSAEMGVLRSNANTDDHAEPAVIIVICGVL